MDFKPETPTQLLLWSERQKMLQELFTVDSQIDELKEKLSKAELHHKVLIDRLRNNTKDINATLPAPSNERTPNDNDRV